MDIHRVLQLFTFLPALLLLGLLSACSEQEASPVDEPAAADDALTRTPAAPPAGNDGLPEGITLIEEVGPSADDVNIPYSKYRLDNGLTLIIHEDDSDPLVHVDVTYHVGSAREEPQRSGFAHFFEHMMFQGSEHVEDEEHFRIVTEAGGTMNGTTNNDRTNYFATVPSNQLETMFWLESDRMGFLLEAVTEEKFEVQRATVKNERGQNVENQPYGRWSEVTFAALYPPGHPYHWPVIGYPEDLDAASVDDLKNFFLRWYGPNNATLSVGGNVDKKEAIELAIRYFGEIPAGPAVEADHRDPATLDQDRYVSYVDSNIRFPGLMFTWPTVALDHPDRVALEALNNIIGVGRKSYLYKEFILTQKAIQSSGFHNSMELAGALTLFVLPFPGTPLSQFEDEMRAVLEDFGPESITEEDIQSYKATSEASIISSLASVSGKVSQLAYYQTFLDDPNNIQQELEAIRSLSREDVIRVFNTYIKDKPAVIESVVPSNDPEGQAKPDNYTIPARLSRTESANDDIEPRSVASSFDRSVKPVPGANPLVEMPAYWQETLDNDLEFIGTSHAEVPMTTLRLVFDGGHLLEEPSQYGIASLTASMMDEGTEQFSAEEFEEELRKLGSNISVGSGSDTFSVFVQSLDRNLGATLELLEERLFHSVFTQADLDRLRQQQIESIEANKQQPSTIAGNVYRQLVYGEDHAYSVANAGKPETLETLTLEDIEAFRDASLAAGSLDVVVVGNIDQESILGKLDFLQQLPDSTIDLRPQPDTSEANETTLYLVDKPDAAQSEIRIGYMSDLTYDPTGKYFERSLMNYPLGGAFNSRININLREDKGYTYGARSGFRGGRLPGPFTASASVLIDATADSVVQFMTELENYRDNGITEEELQFTKDAIGQSEALDYETPGQKAGLLRQIVAYDLEGDFVRQQQQIISNMNTERIDELALEYLPIENMYILVVGDKSVIGESVEALGYPIVELDTEGMPVQEASE